MSLPEYDWELHRDLMAMRERYGNHRRFYKSAAWRRLRGKVLAEFHFESYDELRASPARYVPATCVHHDRYVDKYPGWALSEWWLDNDGTIRRNLFPLSHDAHDARHGRCGSRVRTETVNPLADEWW